MGGEAYATIGTERSRARACSRSRATSSGPGNYELPLTATLRDLIEGHGGGAPEGRTIKAIIPGGSSTPILMPDQIDTHIDYESIAAAGSMAGSRRGGGDRRPHLHGAARPAGGRSSTATRAAASARPAARARRWGVDIIRRIEMGEARQGELDLLLNVCDRILGKCLCPLGDAMAMPVASYVTRFRDGVPAPHRRGRLPVRRATARSHRSQPRGAGALSDFRDAFARLPPVETGEDPELVVPGDAVAEAPEEIALAERLYGDVDDAGDDDPTDGDRRDLDRHARPSTAARSPCPKGMSLVEAAAEAGVEMPGVLLRAAARRGRSAPAACAWSRSRACPKLQTACTDAGRPTAWSCSTRSDRVSEGQDAVLEFLLVNHPLDCPVCDKGGECPLQDLTFRYGPGQHAHDAAQAHVRQAGRDLAADRSSTASAASSATAAPRFSAGDRRATCSWSTENAARTRSSPRSRAAPYDGAFSGNVTELCPVGALTSTTTASAPGRGRSRTSSPCAAQCPVGCNTSATIREGHVARCCRATTRPSTTAGCATAGRYTHSSLDAASASPPRLIRGGRGLEPVAGSDAR